MNSQQKLKLKRGARQAMLRRVWHCPMCDRGQIGGKTRVNDGQNIYVVKRCRYCKHEFTVHKLDG